MAVFAGSKSRDNLYVAGPRFPSALPAWIAFLTLLTDEHLTVLGALRKDIPELSGVSH
jgi:hypothetical protein